MQRLLPVVAVVTAVAVAAAAGLSGASSAPAAPTVSLSAATNSISAVSSLRPQRVPAPSAPLATPLARAAAVRGATGLVSTRPARLHAGGGDAFTASAVVSGDGGLQHVAYERSYRGLPVVGGDFVATTDSSGRVLSLSDGEQASTLTLSTQPRLSTSAAAAIARVHGAQAPQVTSTRLVVLATPTANRLAYESVVTGHLGALPSRRHVFVDAASGAVLRSTDDVTDNNGTGAGWLNGPSPFTISTTGSGKTFSLTDPTRPGISCRGYTKATKTIRSTQSAVLTGTDNSWGNGDGSSVETGCADALYVVQHEWDMLRTWLGRSGFNGRGSGFPVYVGLDDVNAYWDGSSVSIGHNLKGKWITSLDVVGHEFGHAIDSNTPGGMSANGVSEATGDIFGALTEFYADERAPYDTPDFSIGESVNLVGGGPIRQMYAPALLGSPSCYSSRVPSLETHAAAGPFDHWFVLLAQGSAASGGLPASPTCNGTSVTGLGIVTAGKIFYNAMLTKTADMTYLNYRTATLAAAKNLFPGNCVPFATVKAAWDAISVPAQSGEVTCGTAPPVVANPGNRTAARGVPTSLQLTATGGPTPRTWSATGLPAGLSINPTTGLVSGTPSAGTTSSVTVSATGGGGVGRATFSWLVTTTCAQAGQVMANPGFESGTTSWTGAVSDIGVWGSAQPAHTGIRSAYLDGWGRATLDTISQLVTIPVGCRATLGFWVHVDSAETSSAVHDQLSVRLGTTTLRTLSNLDAKPGYVGYVYDVSALSGQTVALTFTGVEDSSFQTSFAVDDTSLTTS